MPPFSASSHPEDTAAAWMRASLQIVTAAAKAIASDIDCSVAGR